MSGRPATVTVRAVRVERGRLGQDQARAGHRGERGEVDMRLVRCIRCGSGRAACQNRAFQARGRSASGARRVRAHGEAAQHLDMRVAGAEQDDVGLDRAGRLHGDSVSGFGRVVLPG